LQLRDGLQRITVSKQGRCAVNVPAVRAAADEIHRIIGVGIGGRAGPDRG
jgi:hypothetical protein